MAKQVTVKVSSNTTVTGPDGVLCRAGDEFTVDDDATLAQWLAAGVVAKVPARRAKRR